MFSSQSTKQAKPAKRVIGPIPPRDKHGKMLLIPNMGKKLRTNQIGEPIRGADGLCLEEEVDLREPWEYKVYEPGIERHMQPGCTKGLRLFEVDYSIEPLCQLYAHDSEDALRLYKKEMGVIRFGHDADGNPPKITVRDVEAGTLKIIEL